MKKKFVGVRMPDDILIRVKKMAGDQGRSVSETVGLLVRKSLESGPVSGPGMDPETIRKEVESVLGPGLGEIRMDLRIMRAELAGLHPNALRGIVPEKEDVSPEVVRFLTEKAARIDALLVGVSSKISGSNVGDHADRMKQANVLAQGEIKKLFGD